MNIKEFLEKIDVSQDDFAAFTGIPRPRIAAWINHKKDTPPKASDANIYSIAVKFLSEKSREEAGKAVKNYRIIANNVEPIKGYEHTIPPAAATEEQAEPYKRKSDTEALEDIASGAIKSLNSVLNKKEKMTLDRILSIWEESNTNIGIIARALDKFADSQKSLSSTVDKLVPPAVVMHQGKRRQAD